MTIQADAIYEGGVLRPLSPLNLQEHEVVTLSILPHEHDLLTDEAAKQRRVLLAHVAKVESAPDGILPDGLSNRDHDRLIYGT